MPKSAPVPTSSSRPIVPSRKQGLRFAAFSLALAMRAIHREAMREIVFDTETTGLSPAGGDRIVEIGCVELFNRVETGRTFHSYFNPGRPMPSEAEQVHGLSDRFLS